MPPPITPPFRLPLSGIDAAILVGGLGTRLRPVVDGVPKPLAPVLGRPFLFYLLDMLALRGARSVVLCCGYRAETVRETVGETWLGMPVHYSVEAEPLGTGGALALAAPHLRSDPVLALNGDSWFTPDFGKMRGALAQNAGCIALAKVEDPSHFGAVEMDPRGHITAFREKMSGSDSRTINSGVYLFAQNFVAALPKSARSLERDEFPQLAASASLVGALCHQPFLDIGTPESFSETGAFFTRLGIAPCPMFPDFPYTGPTQIKLGTSVVILDERGRILLEKRADCGLWGAPGGAPDPGERLARTAEREAFEETGLSVNITGFLGIFSSPQRRTIRYPDNGDLRQLADVAVLAKAVGGHLRKSPESLDLRWFTPGDLPLNTTPPTIEILRAASGWDGVATLA